jgi:hypothetical protein
LAYELSFAPEFFWGEGGGPYEGGWQTKTRQPCSVAQALYNMDDEDWAAMIYDVFPDANPDFVEITDVMERIEETNTVGTLSPPVDVWIDEAGFWTVDVYECDPDTGEAEDIAERGRWRERLRP